jgi:hypothetical protein
MRRSALLFAVACLLCVGVLAAQRLNDANGNQDVGRYREIGQSVTDAWNGQQVEMTSEYPPLASSFFFALSHDVTGESFGARWLIAIVLFAALASIAYAMFGKGNSVIALPLGFLLTTVLVGNELTLLRYDVFVGILLVLVWKAHKEGHLAWSAALLAIATCIKVTPLFLFPILFAVTPFKTWGRLIRGTIAGVLAGIAIPFMLMGPSLALKNAEYVIGYHETRGVQFESLWSSVNLFEHWLHGTKGVLEYHSMSAQNMDFAPASAWWLGMILIVGLGAWAVFLALGRAKRTEDMGLSLLAGLFWMLGIAPILSPQYLLWVLPLFFAWMIERHASFREIPARSILLAIVVTATAVITNWFSLHYNLLADEQSTAAILLLLIRNLLLLVAAALCVAQATVRRFDPRTIVAILWRRAFHSRAKHWRFLHD